MWQGRRPLRLAAMARTLSAVLFWDHLWVARAWDKDGHEAIGMTTMSALQPEPVAQVKRLMHGRDAVDVAAWAHKVNKKYPWTVELHFQRQPNSRCDTKGVDMSGASCQGNKCLVQAMKHFYARLVNNSGPPPEIDWGKGIKLTDADCVKYLINLVGDIHQPLHLAGVDSANLSVHFRGKVVSMYDIWDHELAAATIKESPGFWWGGWTHVERTRQQFEYDQQAWAKNGIQEFERWANESTKYLCENIYSSHGSSRLQALKDGTYRLEEDQFQIWKREMLNKMLVAGARVAIVLNSVLHHREGSPQLNAGTSVAGVDEAEDEYGKVDGAAKLGRRTEIPHGANVITGVAAFGANIIIFLVVGVVFLQIMRTWRGKDIIAQADRAKQQQGGGKRI